MSIQKGDLFRTQGSSPLMKVGHRARLRPQSSSPANVSCSSRSLVPSHAPALKSICLALCKTPTPSKTKGIDEIVCVAVNDAYGPGSVGA